MADEWLMNGESHTRLTAWVEPQRLAAGESPILS